MSALSVLPTSSLVPPLSESEPISSEPNNSEPNSSEPVSKSKAQDKVTNPKSKSKKIKLGACTVCCEEMNLSTRKQVSCPHCQYTACRQCYYTYFLSLVSEPQCMNCHRPWNYPFLFQNFTKVWIKNVYQPHRATLLMAHEKSLLGDAMSIIEWEQKAADLHAEWERCSPGSTKSALYAKYKLAQKKTIHALLCRHRSQLVPRHVNNVQELLAFLRPNDGRVVEKKPAGSKFQYNCFTPDCRGILNAQMTCLLCRVCFCKHCHCVLCQNIPDQTEPSELHAEHKCDPAVVETVKMIEKSSQQCPKCRALIHRSEGCDQMWCTQCHTAFNYRTGKIIEGTIHNPHYFEHLRRQHQDQKQEQKQAPHAPTLVPALPECGLPILSQVLTLDHLMYFPWERLYYDIQHTREVTLAIWNRKLTSVDFANSNVALRVMYIKKTLDEIKWKSILMLEERRMCAAQEIIEILHTWLDTMEHQIRLLFHTPVTEHGQILLDIMKHTRLANYYLHQQRLAYRICTPRLFYVTNPYRVIINAHHNTNTNINSNTNATTIQQMTQFINNKSPETEGPSIVRAILQRYENENPHRTLIKKEATCSIH